MQNSLNSVEKSRARHTCDLHVQYEREQRGIHHSLLQRPVRFLFDSWHPFRTASSPTPTFSTAGVTTRHQQKRALIVFRIFTTTASRAGTQTQPRSTAQLWSQSTKRRFAEPCCPKVVIVAVWSRCSSAQTGNLKDAVSNAALIGSVLGQLGFGFAGDL